MPNKVAQNVSIEAVCPETVTYGTEFRYELIVRNTGTAAISGVRVDDQVPTGAKYVGSDRRPRSAAITSRGRSVRSTPGPRSDSRSASSLSKKEKSRAARL